MPDEIFISIKPQYTRLIESREKHFEFRSYKPKHDIKRFWIYESAPSSQLKYIADVNLPVQYPNKIPVLGDGDERFNSGQTNLTHAYKIIHLYKLSETIKLEKLKLMFNFSPPQCFAYVTKYEKLMNFILSDIELIKIF